MTLDEVRVGDTVLVSESWGTNSHYLRKVSHVTATQIHVQITKYATIKFSRKDGLELGKRSGYIPSRRIGVPTPEEIAQVRAAERRRSLIAKIQSVPTDQWSDEDVSAIHAIIAKYLGQGDER